MYQCNSYSGLKVSDPILYLTLQDDDGDGDDDEFVWNSSCGAICCWYVKVIIVNVIMPSFSPACHFHHFMFHYHDLSVLVMVLMM